MRMVWGALIRGIAVGAYSAAFAWIGERGGGEDRAAVFLVLILVASAGVWGIVDGRRWHGPPRWAYGRWALAGAILALAWIFIPVIVGYQSFADPEALIVAAARIGLVGIPGMAKVVLGRLSLPDWDPRHLSSRT